jgi:hypothetical protein
MKKIIISLFLISAFTFVNAQNVLTSKNGTPILPEKGDWAIGISASPFLTYFGDFLSQHGNTSPTFDFFTGDNSIIGKYFLTDKTAVRARLRIGLTSTSYTNYVSEDGSSDPFAQVKDKETIGATNFTLGLGMEKRRGKGRLQGFYGAEAVIGLASGHYKYTYGNDFSSTNTSPTSTNFDGNINGDKSSSFTSFGASSRETEYKTGSTFNIGARAFIGAEYFILPKVSFGGEFGWGIALDSSGAGTDSIEYWGGSAVKSFSEKVGNPSSFGLDTDNLSGNLFLTLHF